MTFNTHLITGLLIGAATGEYVPAIIGALLPDIDHLPDYYQKSLLRKPRILLATMLSRHDPGGDQRGFLHNFGIVIAPLLSIFFTQPHWYVFAISFTSHLLLDVLDSSIYYPLYPRKTIAIRGPITYNSFQEVALIIGMCLVFFTITALFS